MMTPYNKKADCGGGIDRISDLPNDVIDRILGYLPMIDIIRTSVLSRKWRFMWVSVPQIEFEDQFFINCRNLGDHEFSSIITKVLSLHNGPVYKFIFYNYSDHTIRIECLEEWILYLSRSGIKYLELGNPHQIPSHVFSCQELTHLKLGGFNLSIPPNFHGFKSLLVLELDEIRFEAGALDSLISGCPLLEELTITTCFGFECIDVSAPSLKALHITSCLQVTKSICLKKAKNLIDLKLIADGDPERSTLSDLIKGLPKIERLVMGKGYIKMLSPAPMQSMVQWPFGSLKYLELDNVDFDEIEQLLLVVNFLKSAPNLVELVIKIYNFHGEVWNPTWNFERDSCCLSQLQTVNISVTRPSEYATTLTMRLIRFILAKSPSLETLTLQQHKGDPILSSNSQDLLQMELASSRAQVRFLYRDILEL